MDHRESLAPGATQSLSDRIEQNIDSVVAFQRQEWGETSASQRRVERVSRFIGRPIYLIGIVGFVGVWIASQVDAPYIRWTPFDPWPFPILHGVLTLIALFTTTIVLIAQNRLTKLEQQNAHLDLQVNLLTEQKVTKLVHLMEELRRDLPMVRDRHDPQAAAMQQPADAGEVLSAIKDGGLAAQPEGVAPLPLRR